MRTRWQHLPLQHCLDAPGVSLAQLAQASQASCRQAVGQQAANVGQLPAAARSLMQVGC
jgi:hypothetical protein